MMVKISIYGCGMFGFALAKHFGDKFEDNDEYNIVSYDRNVNVVECIQKTRMHPFHFQNKKLSKKNGITNDIYELLHNSDILILVVPSQSVREVVKNLRPFINENIIIVNTAKALELHSGKLMSEVIKEELGTSGLFCEIAQFSGGTIAKDIVNGAPLGAEIASKSFSVCSELIDLFSNYKLRVYGNNDLNGVEYAGAFKNVISILAGIIGGMNLPYGSETHLISRAAKEAMNISLKLGAKQHTFTMESQSWGNDLWMSCTGKTRNRYFGELIGKGLAPKDALIVLEKEHKIAEGYNTVQLMPQLVKRTNCDCPILMNIYEMLYSNKMCEDAIKEIMLNDLEHVGT